jgi:hypothetical protein
MIHLVTALSFYNAFEDRLSRYISDQRLVILLNKRVTAGEP